MAWVRRGCGVFRHAFNAPQKTRRNATTRRIPRNRPDVAVYVERGASQRTSTAIRRGTTSRLTSHTPREACFGNFPTLYWKLPDFVWELFGTYVLSFAWLVRLRASSPMSSVWCCWCLACVVCLGVWLVFWVVGCSVPMPKFFPLKAFARRYS